MKLVYVLLLVGTLPFVSAIDMGVSPGRIIKENLLPGSTLEEVMVLTKSTSESITVHTQVQGNAAEWITYPSNISFSQGETRVRVPLGLEVPQGVELGNYSATIDYLVPGDRNLHLAFSVPLTLTVTDQEDVHYQVKHVTMKQKGTDVLMEFEVHNRGNVPSGPHEVHLLILDTRKATVLHEMTEEVETAAPFSISTMSLTFDPHVQEGNYWVNVTFSGEEPYMEQVFLEMEEQKDLEPSPPHEEVESPSTKNPFWLLVSIVFISLACIFLASSMRTKK